MSLCYLMTLAKARLTRALTPAEHQKYLHVDQCIESR
jgi:hypothetical protein